ncbi:MAG: hypothetical protein NZ893_00295 [Candidatus Aenigmarchaeota archaeon]|nr:hypothetical protein [Candidatus Aenigmarchaeota archaeon]
MCECGGHLYYKFDEGFKAVDICLICGKTRHHNKLLNFLFGF